MAARNDPMVMVPFGARFFKNARTCPRPANPHSQALRKSSTVHRLSLSTHPPLCVVLAIARPPSIGPRDACGKRLRRLPCRRRPHQSSPDSVDVSTRLTATTTLFAPWHVLALQPRVSAAPSVNARESQTGHRGSRLDWPTPRSRATLWCHSVIPPNTVALNLTRTQSPRLRLVREEDLASAFEKSWRLCAKGSKSLIPAASTTAPFPGLSNTWGGDGKRKLVSPILILTL
jgi:hypothetical protein